MKLGGGVVSSAAPLFTGEDMNDNLTPEGPAHAYALGLLNDLAVLLRNAEARGLDVLDENGERVFQFGFWADECDKATGITPIKRKA